MKPKPKPKLPPKLLSLWDGRSPNDTPYKFVEWTDIQSTPAWDASEENQVAPVRRITTGGWVVYEGEDPLDPGREILVAAGTFIHDTEKFADYTVYPRYVVKAMYDRPPKGKKK